MNIYQTTTIKTMDLTGGDSSYITGLPLDVVGHSERAWQSAGGRLHTPAALLLSGSESKSYGELCFWSSSYLKLKDFTVLPSTWLLSCTPYRRKSCSVALPTTPWKSTKSDYPTLFRGFLWSLVPCHAVQDSYLSYSFCFKLTFLVFS